jgi:uncharacterized repeat protein (TIGR01451 family)
MLKRGVTTILLLSGVLYSMGTPPPNYDNSYDREIEEAVSADIESIQASLEAKKKAKLSSLSITSLSFQEKIIIRNNGKKVKKNIPVTQVVKGTKVVYINRLKNKNSEIQTNIVVKNPIPKGTKYVQGSAICEKGCKISYSTDGGETLNSLDKNGVSYIEFYFPTIHSQKEVRMGFRAIIK